MSSVKAEEEAAVAGNSRGEAASGEGEPAPGGLPAAADAAAAELTSEPAAQRPASRASDVSARASEADLAAADGRVAALQRAASRASNVSASASEADLAAADRPDPPRPPLAQLERSPFFDLQHPIGWYEGAKLLLMAPVVAVKARPEREWCWCMLCMPGSPPRTAADPHADPACALPPPSTAAAAGVRCALCLGRAGAAAAGPHTTEAHEPLQASLLCFGVVPLLLAACACGCPTPRPARTPPTQAAAGAAVDTPVGPISALCLWLLLHKSARPAQPERRRGGQVRPTACPSSSSASWLQHQR